MGSCSKRAMATDMLPAVDAVLAGLRYVSPEVREEHKLRTAEKTRGKQGLSKCPVLRRPTPNSVV